MSGAIVEITDRAMQEMFKKYRHSLLLLKIYNDVRDSSDWLDVDLSQNFNTTNKTFLTIDRHNQLLSNMKFHIRQTKNCDQQS